MRGKDKIKKALNHQETNVLIDLGSNSVTGMHVSMVGALRDYYGLEKKPVKVIEPYQMLGKMDEDLKLAIGVDVDGLYPFNTIFGFENKGWKKWRTPWDQDVMVPEKFVTSRDESNI